MSLSVSDSTAGGWNPEDGMTYYAPPNANIGQQKQQVTEKDDEKEVGCTISFQLPAVLYALSCFAEKKKEKQY